MPHYTAEQIKMARQIDLLSYLKRYEPDNLVKICNGTYCTKEHDSFKISNGMWNWFSRGIGGKSALDYLINVKGHTFQKSIEILLARAAEMPSVSFSQKSRPKLQLPPKFESSEATERYLRSRGICSEIIRYCTRNGIVYEGVTKKDGRFYHNAVFIGMDESGTPRYAALRGLYSNFKGEAYGSDKRYAFSIPAENSPTVHLFEAAIDLLSYASLEKLGGRSWRKDHLLSLAGVYENKKAEIPLALNHYLKSHGEISEVCLHFDNDEIGRAAVLGIKAALKNEYVLKDVPPRCGKDVNNELMSRRKELSRSDFSR